jgi:hypothetical protein
LRRFLDNQIGWHRACSDPAQQIAMKLNLIPTKKIVLLCTAMCAAMFAFSHNANALTIGNGDPHYLGLIDANGNIGDPGRAAYINYLIGLAVNTSGTFNGDPVTRSANNFSSLPNAVQFANPVNGTGTSVPLGTAGLYSYLWAHYGGPGGGTIKVWYVGDLSGTITIPGSDGHDLSGWALLGPGGAGVPDGGTTVMLLGAALGALGMARRFIKS